jgi:ribosomal protein S18 acetylase RimI-like enzyme
MFASIALAARIDRAEMRLTESVGRAIMASAPGARAFVEAIGGGLAAYAGPSSPMNKMIGVGFEGAPPGRRMQEIEELFAERSAPLQAEVATLGDPAFMAELPKRGYVLENFENVSGRPIVDVDRNPPDSQGIRIDLLSEANAADWIDAAITGAQHPDSKGVPALDLPPRDALEAALRPFATVDGFRPYCAWLDGQLAGVATLRIDDGVAQMCGASTLPRFRRRGVQAALLQRRLADAARAGCDLAVLTTQPGSTSQENGHRQGFALLYARAILVKTPAAVVET